MIKLEEIKIPLRNFVDGERTIEYLSWYIFPLSPQLSVSLLMLTDAIIVGFLRRKRNCVLGCSRPVRFTGNKKEEKNIPLIKTRLVIRAP